MAIRRFMFRWLLPAAFVLPLWLVVGWAVFNAASAPWALLPVLLIFAPAVFFGQLVATLLTRVRPSVREDRAVSWADVGAFAAWHLLTIAVGFYNERTFAIVLPLAIVAGVGVLLLTTSELWRESRVSRAPVIRVDEGVAPTFSTNSVSDTPETSANAQPVIIVREASSPDQKTN